MSLIQFQILILFAALVAGRPNSYDDIEDHWKSSSSASTSSSISRAATYLEQETSSAYWQSNAQATLKGKLQNEIKTKKAKNIIMFLGDGMSVPTLMAARTYLGQLQGYSGEEGSLHWDNFPFSGFSKTYCVDHQVADSACTATAYLTGIKTNRGTLGVNANVARGDCIAMTNTSNHVTSIAEWALNAGKSAGIVTTARVTHASPSGAYAHTAQRNWESDADVVKDGFDPTVCKDIATQLMTASPGIDFQVILGGGRREFLPSTVVDEEGKSGYRKDGVDLIKTWKQNKAARDSSYSYIWNRNELQNIIDKPDDVDYLLGLFESSHCQFNKLADAETEPTLAEMTEAAIKILEKNDNGYFLFVEGGRIDSAHHKNQAHLALDETVELASAVGLADELTDEDDTLIIVTADHGHVMTVSGYPDRGNNILGIGGTGSDDLPYTTLSYANGPSYEASIDGIRHDLGDDDLSNSQYQYPSMSPRDDESHSGDDVAIFARGPWSHLFSGTLEQNTIPHFMAYAACIGTGLTACTE